MLLSAPRILSHQKRQLQLEAPPMPFLETGCRSATAAGTSARRDYAQALLHGITNSPRFTSRSETMLWILTTKESRKHLLRELVSDLHQVSSGGQVLEQKGVCWPHFPPKQTPFQGLGCRECVCKTILGSPSKGVGKMRQGREES